MAEDVSRCGFVLFLDAASAEKPGTIRQTRVLQATLRAASPTS